MIFLLGQRSGNVHGLLLMLQLFAYWRHQGGSNKSGSVEPQVETIVNETGVALCCEARGPGTQGALSTTYRSDQAEVRLRESGALEVPLSAISLRWGQGSILWRQSVRRRVV